MLLYKFGAWPQWSRNVLETQSLHFSEPGRLNDPLDCQIDVVKEYEQAILKFEKSTTEAEVKILKNLLNHELSFRFEMNDKVSFRFPLTEWVGRQMRSSSVLSFSKTPVDALLWAHYADGHAGVCLEFESEEFGTSFSSIACGDVDYLDEPPFQTMLQDTVDHYRRGGTTSGYFHNLHLAANRYIKIGVMTKSVDWKYEQEFRYILSGSRDQPFDPISLKSVILGVRTLERHREEIRAVLQRPALHHVQLKRAVQKPGSFQVEILSSDASSAPSFGE